MDNLVFEESINSEITSSEFVDKQWLYVNDNNNSSYSGQIVLDTTSLANSGSYINWSEAFLSFPMVLQASMTPTTNAAVAAPLDFMMGIKSGGWNIIHSLTCEFNNGSIIQQVPFKNVFCGFKNLTSWSQDDLKNWGMVANFYPDSCDSWLFNNCAVGQVGTNLAGTSGVGLCNNRNSPYIQITTLSATTVALGSVSAYNAQTEATMPRAAIRRNYNKGFLKRQKWLNFNLYSSGGDTAIGAVINTSQYSNQGSLLGSSAPAVAPTGNVAYAGTQYTQSFTSFVQIATGTRAIVFDNIVRLKDVEDFFAKCPLLKGSTMRIYINTNQVLLQGAVLPGTYDSTAATGGAVASFSQLALTAQPIILGGGATCPVMIASADQGQGLQNLACLYTNTADGSSIGLVASGTGGAAAGLQAFVVGYSIVKTQFTSLTSVQAPITSVRLYAPAYTMSPLSEQRYLALNSTHKVIYNDIFQFAFPNIAAGANFNFLVSNGIPNIRSVLVCPFLSTGQNGVATQPGGSAFPTAVQTSTLLSPFIGSGSHPDPINLTNFQIQVSGKNLFINQLQYSYEQFVEQVAMSNQLNGNLTTSLTSGLIGYEEWTNLYRYYFGYAARSIPSEEGVAKAIQVLGINNSSMTIDLMVFIEFERELTIDVRTGARIA